MESKAVALEELERAIRNVQRDLPFEGYTAGLTAAYRNVARTALKYLDPGGAILDFGCGPCDKTAVLQQLGFVCTGYDDLQDPWHTVGDARQRIMDFADHYGVRFSLARGNGMPFPAASFDMVMLHDVLEHLHESPRALVNELLRLVRPGGLLFVTVPNAANIKKRLDVLRGKTNYPNFDYYYWMPGPWRGHVREYVREDLVLLARFAGVNVLELKTSHHMAEKKVPPWARKIYYGVTAVFPGWRDTWLMVARKPAQWQPAPDLPEQDLQKLQH